MAKLIEEHFGRINIGDLDKIISYMRIKLQLILMCVCWPNGIGMETPHKTHVVESYIHGHHMSNSALMVMKLWVC